MIDFWDEFPKIKISFQINGVRRPSLPQFVSFDKASCLLETRRVRPTRRREHAWIGSYQVFFFVSIPISISKINNSKWRYLAFYSSSFPVMFTFGKVCRKIWLNSNVWIQKGRKSIDSTKRTFLQGRVSFIRSSAWTNPQKIRNLRVIISNCLKIAVYCCAWWLLSASVLILSYFST